MSDKTEERLRARLERLIRDMEKAKKNFPKGDPWRGGLEASLRSARKTLKDLGK